MNAPDPAMTKSLTLVPSRCFTEWLGGLGASLAFTTYQGGSVIFIGTAPDGQVSIVERSFPRCMGLAVSADARTLMLATEVQIFRFDAAPSARAAHDKYDARFVPTQSWITGDLDIHDIGIGADGAPIFANTLYSCLATTAAGHNFLPLWRPDFISKLAGEDRCHLNGLAMEGGQARYVTVAAKSDVAGSWSERRAKGGMVIDVQTGSVVAQGLSMPHSPRLHEGRLWLLNSGSAEFGWIDMASGEFNPVAFCPGFARGLAFVGHYAIVGLSVLRSRSIQGLPLEAALEQRGADARCGLMVIDLRTGDVFATLRIEGALNELFDVAVLPGIRSPFAVGLKGAEIRPDILVG